MSASVLIISAFYSCFDSRRKFYAPDEIKEFEITQCNDTVSGTAIPYHNLSGLSGMETVDSFLVFLESDNSERIFSVYNIRDDSMAAWFGTIGHAGNEFLTVPITCYFDRVGTDILMYLSDDGSRTKAVNLSKSIEEDKCHTEASIAHKMRRDCAVTPCDNYVKIGEDKYIARQGISYDDPRDGIFYPPKFLILDKGEQSDIILYPNVIDSKAYTLVYVAYSAEVKVNPQKTKLVEALNYFDITNVIDTDTRKILGLKERGCYDFGSWSGKGTDEDFVRRKLRVYTICANATEHYIILLQDRRLLSEIEGGEPNSNPVLLFFDYNGDLIRELCLANDVIKIAYYEDGHALYGVTSEGVLLKYDLNGLIK